MLQIAVEIKIAIIVFLCYGNVLSQEDEYSVTDEKGILGRTFDGIGGLSGGGPNFGASLQILKVEIGGDDQSTDGTEASHMHEEWEENYNRGYEWWLMIEAKKRNPDIKLYGLPWAWPHWISPTVRREPYDNMTKTASYIVKWILGAKMVHNLTIDYIGIWNEHACDFRYIVILKNMLDQNKLQTQIVACDGGWQNFNNNVNQTVLNSIYAIGAHYPGTYSTSDVLATNKILWASEDYSTYNDDIGAGCWARILNQNYVNGYMTSTIAWNLIASYYIGLPCQECALMTAVQPWSGNYEVKNPIWITAHTTQLANVGWKYLAHNNGVGHLAKNGSYVTLISPDKKDLTIIIETMTHEHSICIRPTLPQYTIAVQNATFVFGGSFTNITQLYLYKTQLKFDGKPSTAFVNSGAVDIIDNMLTLTLDVDSVYTLSTLNTGVHGDSGPIPDPASFPLPYSDNFQNYNVSAEPYNLVPQAGSWEIEKNPDGSLFARQTVLTNPVAWCEVLPRPIALIGDSTWRDVVITVDVRFPSANHSDSVFIGAQIPMDATGCQYAKSFSAIFLWFDRNNSTIRITRNNTKDDRNILSQANLKFTVEYDTWYTLTLNVKQYLVSASVNNVQLLSYVLPDSGIQNGFAAIGSGSYGYTDIRNLHISSPYSTSSQSTVCISIFSILLALLCLFAI